MSVIKNKELKMRMSDNESSEFAWYSTYETLGAVDGPGLRLIIFLQGCPVQCLFCHNPETTPFSNKEKKITIDEVIDLYKRNKSFYGENGGITLSGGESMAQINFVLALFKRCREEGIHTALDTAAGPMALLKPKELSELLEFTDLFIIDIKHPDNEVCIELTGTGNVNQLALIKLCEQQKVHFWVRHVYVPTYSDRKEEYMINLGRMIANLKMMDKFEILPYHNMAIFKYENLGWAYQLKELEPPTAEQLAEGMKLINEGVAIAREDLSKSLI